MCSIGTHKRKPHRLLPPLCRMCSIRTHRNLPCQGGMTSRRQRSTMCCGWVAIRIVSVNVLLPLLKSKNPPLRSQLISKPSIMVEMVLTLKTENLSLGMTMTASICRAAKPCGLTVPHQSYHGKTQLSALDSFCRTDTLRPM